MMVPFFDIHTHRYKPQEDEISIYNPLFVTPEDSFSCSWISLGIHPWYVDETKLTLQMTQLESAATNPLVKLIGECGLDRLRGPSISVQQQALSCQLELAVRLNKPVIVHCVRAFDLLLPFGKRYGHQIPLIIHGFNKSPDLAKQLMQHGFMLAFGAAILRSGSGAANTVSHYEFPFFLETDDDDLSIRDVYKQVAFLRGVSLEVLKDAIFANWKTIGLI